MDKKVILAVDDMAMNLRTIKVILEEEYEVLLVKSGEIALDMLQKTKIDLVLLDIEMPGMTGFEVIDSMRKIPGCEEIPVIFITSHVASDLIVTAYDHGAGDYMVKPINAEVLRNRIYALLSRSGGGAS
jgi:putative two-component system response regulator